MPAPTALLQEPEEIVQGQEGETVMQDAPVEESEGVLLDPTAQMPAEAAPLPTNTISEAQMEVDSEGRPQFPPQKDAPLAHRVEARKVPVRKLTTRVQRWHTV
jgi:hypothetical protein